MPDVELDGGRMPWAQAYTEHLAGLTCLWQDLDGVHVAPAPAEAPYATHVWGWDDETLVRVRLDGATAYVARVPSAELQLEELLPWSPGDGQVGGLRPADGLGVGDVLGRRLYRWVHDDLIHGPITFIRLEPPAHQRAGQGAE